MKIKLIINNIKYVINYDRRTRKYEQSINLDITAKEIRDKCKMYAKSFCLKNNIIEHYDDIVSDLTLNIFKALPKCNGTSSLSTFIYGCNRNRTSRYWSIKKVNDAMGLGKNIQYTDEYKEDM